MNKMSDKVYYCPVCGKEETHSTNHTLEIYTPCKKCGNTILYCKGVSLGNAEKKCKIVFYKFDIAEKDEKDKYKNLQTELKGRKYKVHTDLERHAHFSELQKHDKETISLFRVSQFDNQYVSTIGRVFNWYEGIFGNKHIKSGYYLNF